jgi:hypothetical protein
MCVCVVRAEEQSGKSENVSKSNENIKARAFEVVHGKNKTTKTDLSLADKQFESLC